MSQVNPRAEISDSVLRRLLPESVAAIAEHSPQLALKFCLAFGGRTIHIPKRVRESCPLSVELGFDDAKMVSQLIGGAGAKFTVPTCHRAVRYKRDVEIFARSVEGASVNTLSKEFGVHEVTVRRALRRQRLKRKSVPVAAHRSGE